MGRASGRSGRLRLPSRPPAPCLPAAAPPPGRAGETEDGRLTVRVFPANRLDALLFMGISGDVHLEADVDEAELHRSRAAFYKRRQHDGEVCLVLGAGTVTATPPP